jgi:hypothetical protein
MTCYLCKGRISKQDKVEYHHPIYKSQGGTVTAPTHKACHRQHHSTQGDFAHRWQFNGINKGLVSQSQKRQHASRICFRPMLLSGELCEMKRRKERGRA